VHKSSYDKVSRFVELYLDPAASLEILDLGAYDVNGTYQPLFDKPGWRYRGADLEPGPNVDVVLSDPYDWKEVEDQSVDVLVSGQALEHIEFFWLTMLEIRKKLRPGGLCCLVAPSRGTEHRYPTDCWRFYPDGFRALAKWARLEPVEVYTQWEPEGYTDGSDQWRDTVGVFRKNEA
jgi:SAM-dependent methyltransferase